MTLFKRSWKQIGLLQLISVVVSLVYLGAELAFVLPKMQDAFNASETDPTQFGSFSSANLILVPFALIVVVVSLTVSLASYQVVVQHATGQRPSIGGALGTAFRRVFPMIGWGIPVGLIIAVSAIACFLPVFYTGAVFSIFPAVVLLERTNVISRCFQLFHANFGVAAGRIGTIVGFGSIGVVIYYVVAFATTFHNGLAGKAPSAGDEITVALVVTILSTAFSLISTPMLLCAYADMRARREPFSTAYLLPRQPSA